MGGAEGRAARMVGDERRPWKVVDGHGRPGCERTVGDGSSWKAVEGRGRPRKAGLRAWSGDGMPWKVTKGHCRSGQAHAPELAGSVGGGGQVGGGHRVKGAEAQLVGPRVSHAVDAPVAVEGG